MTSWSLKKNQQEILNVSHAFVLVFFKDFWNLLKKEKTRNPWCWQNNLKVQVLRSSLTRQECLQTSWFTWYQVLLINSNPTTLPNSTTSRLILGFWGQTQCSACFSSTWESWVSCFGGRKGLCCGTLQKSQMFLNISSFRNMQGLILCSHLGFADSW